MTSENVQTLTIGVNGMSCDNCVHHVQQALSKVPGVAAAAVDLAAAQATVSFDSAACDVDSLYTAIEAAGYEAAKS